MRISEPLTVNKNTGSSLFQRPSPAWLMLLSLIGGLVSLTGANAQENLYGKYSQLPISDKYLLESAAPRMVGNKFEDLSDKEKKEIGARNRTKRTAISEDKRRVSTLIEGGNLNDPLVTSFFKDYVFAEMTQLGDQSFDKLSNLGNLRTEFLKSYLSPKMTGPARQRFIDTICLPQLKVIYSDPKLHPAARLSAVYLLGLLDVVPGARSPATAPTASPQALDQLMEILQAKDSEAFLKVGAWAGLQRHVEIDAAAGNQIPEPKKSQIKQVAIQVIDGKFTGQDSWEADLSYWMKRRSTQMLGLLKDQATLTKIVEVLDNTDHNIWLRLDALEAIERLGLVQVDSQVVQSIGKFLAEAIAAESQWIKSERENLIFENLLYEDVDLEETGTNWKDESADAVGGQKSGGGRFGRARKSLGGLGGDTGMSEGMGSEGGEGGRGSASSGKPAQPTEGMQKQVELPNYMLNLSRRRIKSLAFIGKRVLKPVEDAGLHKAADAANKTKIDQMVAPLERLLKDSDVGLVNLSVRRPASIVEEPADEAPKKSVTEQLMDACDAAAKSLNAILQPKDQPKAGNPLGS